MGNVLTVWRPSARLTEHVTNPEVYHQHIGRWCIVGMSSRNDGYKFAIVAVGSCFSCVLACDRFRPCSQMLANCGPIEEYICKTIGFPACEKVVWFVVARRALPPEWGSRRGHIGRYGWAWQW